MKAKRILIPAAAAALFLLPGCNLVSITNLTPDAVNANPSGTYTMSVRTEPHSDTLNRSTLKTSIVIDGEKRPMEQSGFGTWVYDYDYKMPEGRDEARYYFVVNYRLNKIEAIDPKPARLREETSDLYTLQVDRRFSITLEAERAPVGTPLAILGRGFTRGDQVYVGGTRAVTRFISSNSLEFVVPSLPTGVGYPVEVRNGADSSNAGTLRVDPGTPLRVTPSEIEIEKGGRQVLLFSVDFAAPEGGLPITVTTDIPDSVIMPEVVIPGGERTVSVPLEAGQAGRGSLFISMRGAGELVVPITVR